jgi:acyl-CoA thioesterase FadM
MPDDTPEIVDGYRFHTQLPLRHTDSFGGTPFVHGGVLLALTEIALDTYDRETGLPSHRDVLRMQSHTQVRYRAPLRWDDEVIIRLRCTELRRGRLVFDALVESVTHGTTIAELTHRYAYINATTGRPQTPEDWPAIVEAIRAYEFHALIEQS